MYALIYPADQAIEKSSVEMIEKMKKDLVIQEQKRQQKNV